MKTPKTRRKAAKPAPPALPTYPITYAQVKTGDYFMVQGGYREVAFLQTDDNTTFRDYYGNKGKGFSRPLPTRLWDAAFHGLDDDTPARIVTGEEAAKCAKAYRAL